MQFISISCSMKTVQGMRRFRVGWRNSICSNINWLTGNKQTDFFFFNVIPFILEGGGIPDKPRGEHRGWWGGRRPSLTGGPAYYVLHPQKGITICVFLTCQAFKNREGIVSQTNLAEWFKIWHLWVETNKNMDDL